MIQRRLVLLGLGSFLVVVGICLAVATWMLREWPQPMIPVFVVGVALLIVYLIQGTIWLLISRKELESGVGAGGESAEERAIKRLVGLVLQVAIGLFALAIFAFWIIDDVRVKVLDVFKERGAFYMIQAMNDPSPKVVTLACKNLLAISAFKYEPFVVDGLTRSPKAAAECLSWANEKGMSGGRSIATQLLRQWEEEAYVSADSSKVCPLVDAYAEVASGTEINDPRSFLLECSLSSREDKVRECCASNLESRDIKLAAADVSPSFPLAYSELVTASFREGEADETMKSISSTLSLTSNENRKWVLELGCDLMAMDSQRDVIRGLSPLVSGKTCGLPEDARVLLVQEAAWPQICDEIQEFSAKADVEESLCKSFNRVLKVAAIKNARSEVENALSKYRSLQRAREVDDGGRGVAMSRRASAMANRKRHEINAYIPAGANQDKTHCTRSRLKAHSITGPIQIETYETTLCDLGWEEGLTAEDIKFRALSAALKSVDVQKTGGGNMIRKAKDVGATEGELDKARQEMKKAANE